ncbi:helix-turn-helix domain-containing protein [Paraglaciecola sp.]|uniref:helix-turn-helix domain-containing protein n=1 Tax=Paraglaciecola sp. TaxID=1920173 RepID=UPI0030F460A2
MSEWINRIELKKNSPLEMQGHEYKFGFQRHKPQLMPTSHWHGHIEINYLFDCSANYLFSGRKISVPEGRMIIFWASFPHQMIASEGGGEMVNIYLPLKDFLTWNIPHDFTRKLLHGEVLVSNNLYSSDEQITRIWQNDIHNNDPLLVKQVKCEIRDRIRRMSIEDYASFGLTSSGLDTDNKPVINGFSHLQTMLTYIGDHYDKKITIAEITSSTGLHQNCAMKLFTRIMHVSIKQYINQLRLQHAQAMLIDSDKAVLEIALEAGFGSVSRFYSVFSNTYNMSPLEFRRNLDSYSIEN